MNLTLTQQFHAADAAIFAAPTKHRQLYTAWLGVEYLLEKSRLEAVAALCWQTEDVRPMADGPACGEKISFQFARQFGEQLEIAAKLEAGLAAIEADPDFAAAVATIEPLVAERSRLATAVIAAAAAAAEAQEAAEHAHRDAVERARIACENDPGVALAKQRLEALTNPPQAAPAPALIRGRQKISDVDGALAGDHH